MFFFKQHDNSLENHNKKLKFKTKKKPTDPLTFYFKFEKNFRFTDSTLNIYEGQHIFTND